MFGLTPLGTVHTGLSVVALAAGAWVLVRDRGLPVLNRRGLAYLVSTALVAATSLAIFQRGSFGLGHKMAVATLVALGAVLIALRTRVLGRASPYVAAASFSLTLLLHLIAGAAETLTRLPPAAPLLHAGNFAAFGTIVDGLVALFLAGVAAQCYAIATRPSSPTRG